MAAEGPGLGEAVTDNPFLARLVADAEARPEHRVLDALVGRWEHRTQWELISGRGWQHHRGTTENRWALRGRAIESRTSDHDGSEASRCYLAFDPSNDDFVAFSVSILSTFFVLERGSYDELGPALVLEGTEPVPGRGQVRFRRTITFLGPDRYAVGITYPDHPDGPFGRMFIEHRRIGS